MGTSRSGFWKKKGNRRVRLGSGGAPVLSAPSSPGPRMWGRALLCVGLGAGLAGGGYVLRTALVRGNHFALSELRIVGAKHLSRERILEKSGLELGVSVFSADLAEAERRIARETWIAGVRVRRELPHTISIDIVEREAAIAVDLGSVYLADGDGALFKRAAADEAKGLPLVTGIARSRYLADPGRARAVVRRAIALDHAWQMKPGRATPSELHHEGGFDAAALFTVSFEHGGRTVGARLGTVDASTADRLQRLDAVLSALDAEKAKPELVHLEQRSTDRIAVKLADNTLDTSNKQEGVASPAASSIQAL